MSGQVPYGSMSVSPSDLPVLRINKPRLNARPVERPRPLASVPNSLSASAQRISKYQVSRRVNNAKEWQEDAWDMFDSVGEEHFLGTTLAGRMSQAHLYVGERTEDNPDGIPAPTEDPDLQAILEAVGGNAVARGQLLSRLGVNLFVAGDGWLVGIPKDLIPAHDGTEPATSLEVPLEDMALTDLDWRMLSVSEVSAQNTGEIELSLGGGPGDKITVSPDDIFLIRVWRPHPRRSWEADSPTRASLPVLKELVGLTMQISAQIDSRLAGAGLLAVPQSAQRAIAAAAGIPEEDAGDMFTEALIEAMMTPITDRSSASAVVPLVVTMPDEAVDKIKHITFYTPLDEASKELREESIRRLALSQDAPPELLLGTAGMNHWGAWLVNEDVVSTHLEPPLALICDALTTQYLWPVLMQQGLTEEEAQRYVIWYDVEHLIIRPNRSRDAMSLHSDGVISDEALRQATGFDADDAPTATDPAITLAFKMIGEAPSLAQSPGIKELVDQIRSVLVPEDNSGSGGGESSGGSGELPEGGGEEAPVG